MANFAQLTSNSGFWGSHMSTLMPWGPFIKIQHFDFSYSWTFFWGWSQCATIKAQLRYFKATKSMNLC